MNILFLSSNTGRLCNLSLKNPWHLILMVAVIGGVVGSSAYLGYLYHSKASAQIFVNQWQQVLSQQQQRLEHIQEESEASLNVLSSRLGLLQAHVVRLDALGSRLVSMTDIDHSEFNFGATPALGGPEADAQAAFQPLPISEAIERLSLELENRSNQLQVLEGLVMNENLQKEVKPSGYPVKKGWLSSHYGMRTHPLSGQLEMHNGVDFASDFGAEVIAVAKGVVTYAGENYGYGLVVDIAHGNGFSTRYAHNSKLLVSVGDVLEKGAQIAEVGTSGRSTGPHVHFEVLKDGRQINPMQFINASN